MKELKKELQWPGRNQPVSKDCPVKSFLGASGQHPDQKEIEEALSQVGMRAGRIHEKNSR